MEMLIDALQEYGVPLVFGAVVLEQLGVPIPAFAAMLIAGSVLGTSEAIQHIAAATLACVFADMVWFFIGRRYGTMAMKSVCRVTFAKDDCLNKAMQWLARFGPSALLVSRYIPGLGLMVAPGSGALGFRLLPFVSFSALSGVIWSATAIFLGSWFRDDIRTVLKFIERASSLAIVVSAAAMAIAIYLRAARYFSHKARTKALVEDAFSIV